MVLEAKQFLNCQGQRGAGARLGSRQAGTRTGVQFIGADRSDRSSYTAAILEGVSGRRGGSNKTTRSDMDGSPLLAAAEQSIEVVQPEPEHAPARPTAGFTVPAAAGGDRA